MYTKNRLICKKGKGPGGLKININQLLANKAASRASVSNSVSEHRKELNRLAREGIQKPYHESQHVRPHKNPMRDSPGSYWNKLRQGAVKIHPSNQSGKHKSNWHRIAGHAVKSKIPGTNKTALYAQLYRGKGSE